MSMTKCQHCERQMMRHAKDCPLYKVEPNAPHDTEIGETSTTGGNTLETA